MYVYIYMCVYIYVYIYICIYVYIYICTYIYIYGQNKVDAMERGRYYLHQRDKCEARFCSVLQSDADLEALQLHQLCAVHADPGACSHLRSPSNRGTGNAFFRGLSPSLPANTPFHPILLGFQLGCLQTWGTPANGWCPFCLL